MLKQCTACGQSNRESALFCEFCKANFGEKKAASQKTAAPTQPAPSASGWSTTAVIIIALASVGLGYGLRSLRSPPPAQPPATPAVVAWTPPPVLDDTVEPAPALAAELPKLEPAPMPTSVAVREPEARVEPPPVKPAAPPAKFANQKRFVVPYRPNEGDAARIIIPVKINGGPTVAMALDTGAPGAIITFKLAARLGVLREGDGRLVTQASGIGGSAAAALVVLDSLSVGDVKSDFVPATVADFQSDAFEGLVGMDFLAGYSLQIDTAHNELIFTELPTGPNWPAGHDETWWRRTFRQVKGAREYWMATQVSMQARINQSQSSAGDEADELKKLLTFSQSQHREADILERRLDRYAATHSVPLEWRRP